MNETDPVVILRWSTAEEGQFFERKSAFDRKSGEPKARKAADIAWDVVETLSAMANADGGELVIGMEDDGVATGIPLAEDRLALILGAPRDRNYVTPPLPCKSGVKTTGDGKRVLYFEVDWSPNVHLLADSRCLLRVRDGNEPFDKDKVKALKDAKGQNLFERTFPAAASGRDLDDSLLIDLGSRAWPGQSSFEVLQRYGLLEGRNGHTIPTLAALLLFGREPSRWHDRCGIDFVRWEGTERKSGADLNISKRFRIEAPLALLIEKAFDAIKPFIRERQQLHDLFFSEKLEYPTFAWQEAIVNAVAHRDYSIRGMGIEVWMFNDRMEIRSPGLPPEPVTLEALAKRRHMHCSRNPLIVRILTSLGYMRELGEGVPRMFDEMERAGCYPPRFEAIGGALVQVTLRNEPIYDQATLDWLKHFETIELTGDQKRMLAYAHTHGDQFTSREFQKVIETDIYGASNSIKDMIRKGVVRSSGKGSRIYTVAQQLKAVEGMPDDLQPLLKRMQRKGVIKNEDVQQALGVSRSTAWRIITSWIADGWIEQTEMVKGKNSAYRAGERLMFQS